MGQKVNPIGLRLSLNKKWQSKWFANKQDFGKFLQEDIKIRNFLNSSLKKCGVAKIEIERPAKKPQITIFTARPGLIIGKKVVILKNSKRKYLLLQDKMFRSILLK
jgi:small subunit ribosomal protein S3